MRAFERRGIDLVLDVGANDGSYAADLREAGYRGAIVSFEPQSRAFEQLASARCRRPRLGVSPRRAGLAAARASVVLNVAGNSSSSSLLPMSERHVESAPESQYVGTETVDADDARRDCAGAPRRGGADLPQGRRPGSRARRAARWRGNPAAGRPARRRAVACPALRRERPKRSRSSSYVAERGFRLLDVEPVFLDPDSGEVLQVNGLCGRDR